MLAIRQFSHRYFSILDRYLWREFALNLFAVIAILWLIFVSIRFARYLSQAAVGNLPGDVIFTLLAYSSLDAFSLLLPIATFFAIMLVLSRMNADNELIIIASCGVSDNRLVRNVLVFSGLIALIVSILVFLVIPTVLSDRYELEQKSEMTAETSGLIAGTFKESRHGEWTFYSQNLSTDKASMENIFIEIHRQDHRPLVFRAKAGRFDIDSSTGNKYLILDNGYRYEGTAGDLDFTIAKYATHKMLIEKGGQIHVEEQLKAVPSSVLWHRGHLSDLAELQWRASIVIMTIILALMAINLAKVAPRQGRYAGFFPAILIYILYSNLLGVTQVWVSKGVMPTWLGAVWVHVVMVSILVVMANWLKIRMVLSQKQKNEPSS